MKNILIAGGAGFLGSNFIHYMLEKHPDYNYLILDKLTYTGNTDNLKTIEDKITILKEDICNFEQVKEIVEKYKVDSIINFAGESNEKNYENDPLSFTKTNIFGVQSLLEAARNVWDKDSTNKFIQVSTNDVYGVSNEDEVINESSSYNPNNPFSATKASSDMLALSYYKAYNMNINIANSSYVFGPYQHAENSIPTMICNAVEDRKISLTDNQANKKDYIYVKDHCEAIDEILHNGKAGQKYNIGGTGEKKKIDIANYIVDRLHRSKKNIEIIDNIIDDPYTGVLDSSKITRELNWKQKTSIESGLSDTVDWYLTHPKYLDN